ncbi:alpha/beta fold hydrolase [Ectothiorhodospiraceae bacterium WFHF3C12]|nr:alpha/beta fold hydrolase [Ectothiorhodospiraceae bacterium WFHF3C12]
MTDRPRPVELEYQTRGDGEPLILLHGLYGSGQNWGRHARRLAERYRVVTPDLRNHGGSPHVSEMTYRAMAADVLALMDRLEIDRATLVGHSMGGKAAMATALEAPERVRRFCAADIAPVAYSHGHDRIIEALQAVDTTSLSSRQDADDALADRIEEGMVRQFLLTNLERGEGGYRWRIPLDILAGALADIEGWPEYQNTFDGPALFLYGGQSDYMDASGKKAARAHFPAARLACIKSAGHWLHVEAADTFAEILDTWLARETPAAS